MRKITKQFSVNIESKKIIKAGEVSYQDLKNQNETLKESLEDAFGQIEYLQNIITELRARRSNSN